MLTRNNFYLSHFFFVYLFFIAVLKAFLTTFQFPWLIFVLMLTRSKFYLGHLFFVWFIFFYNCFRGFSPYPLISIMDPRFNANTQYVLFKSLLICLLLFCLFFSSIIVFNACSFYTRTLALYCLLFVFGLILTLVYFSKSE